MTWIGNTDEFTYAQAKPVSHFRTPGECEGKHFEGMKRLEDCNDTLAGAV